MWQINNSSSYIGFVCIEMRCRTSDQCPRVLKLSPEAPWCSYRGRCTGAYILRCGRSGLKSRLHEVQWVADYYAYGAGDVTGPEVCGHGGNGMERCVLLKLGKFMWRGTLTTEECGA